jgi:Flp pilus assembly protein TadG
LIRTLISVSRQRRPDEEGGAAVEFAVVCPVLLLFVAGVIEGSLVLYTRGNMEHIARQAARAAAIGSATAVEAETFVETKMAQSIGSPAASATVNFVGGATPIEDEVVVQVTVPEGELSAILPFRLFRLASLSTTVTMHYEAN